MLSDLLVGEGVTIGRDRGVSVMRRMGIVAIYRRPNQVWAINMTYIPMARGFVYLATVVWRFVHGT